MLKNQKRIMLNQATDGDITIYNSVTNNVGNFYGFKVPYSTGIDK